MCADPDYLRVARTATHDVAQVIGFKENEIETITLAVVEAITNVIRHSYAGPCDKPIIVKLNKINYPDVKKAGLEVVIRDFGKQVDPENIKGRDLDELRPGGGDKQGVGNGKRHLDMNVENETLTLKQDEICKKNVV